MNKEINIIFQLVIAIERKKVVKLVYNGNSRMVEPFLLGENAEGIVLRGFCLKEMDWRIFKISKITSVEITGKSFNYSRSGYTKGQDKSFKKILQFVK